MDPKAIDSQVSEILLKAGSPKELTPHSFVQLIIVTNNTTMTPMINQMNERLASLEERAKIIEEKVAIIDQHQTQLKTLEAECVSLREENADLKKNLRKAMSTALDNKRHSHQYNLLLHGVSEDHPKIGGATDARNANFRDAVLTELRQFDATITEKDFERAHRLGPPKPAIANALGAPPRAILIKFYSRYVKEQLLEESIRRYKALKQDAAGSTIDAPKKPYLTSHRVRELSNEEDKSDNKKSHVQETAFQGQRGRKRGGNQRSPLQGVTTRRRRDP